MENEQFNKLSFEEKNKYLKKDIVAEDYKTIKTYNDSKEFVDDIINPNPNEKF